MVVGLLRSWTTRALSRCILLSVTMCSLARQRWVLLVPCRLHPLLSTKGRPSHYRRETIGHDQHSSMDRATERRKLKKADANAISESNCWVQSLQDCPSRSELGAASTSHDKLPRSQEIFRDSTAELWHFPCLFYVIHRKTRRSELSLYRTN